MAIKNKVSIIIPIYNAEKTISRCIDSILQETNDNIEIILVNDGSSDNSLSICEEYTNRCNFIKLINQTNSGPSKARNTGIRAVRGDYIQFVDSDDFIENNMTYNLVKSMNENIDLVISGYVVHFLYKGVANKKKRVPSFLGIYSKSKFLEEFGLYFQDLLINSPCNKLYRTDLIKENRLFFDEEIFMGEDLLFNLKYINQCKKIKIIADTLYHYNAIDTNSLTKSYQKDRYNKQKILFAKIEDFLENNQATNKDNKSALKTAYFKSIILSFENIINSENQLIKKEKIDKIKTIINDIKSSKTLINMDGNELSFQRKFIFFLISKNMPYVLYCFFASKGSIRRFVSNVKGTYDERFIAK